MKLNRRNLVRGALGAGGVAALPACAGAKIVGYDPVRRTLDVANQGEPLSLDPHKCSGTWENNIVGNLFMGLTTEGDDGSPLPGMATRWETSADGLSWIFHLRQAYWSDGEPVDAHDFVFAYQRILNPENLAEYASLLYPIKNAQRVNSGEAHPREVGVRALDDRTLEIQLEHPAPYLPELLMHYTNYPVPKHVVEAHGDAWIKPENVVVNGPYKLVKWWSNYIVHITKNPAFFDSRNVWLDDIYFYPSNDVNAASRSVISGERGWSTRFPSNRTPELTRDHGAFVQVHPYLVVNYFAFNMTRPPFDDIRVRRALTMSLDRDFLATQIYRAGERPAHSFVPPGIAGYKEGARYSFADTPIAQRRETARALLQEAGFGPNNPLRFEFTHRNTSDNPRVAVVAQADWRAIAPWVTCELQGQETQIHYSKLRAKDFQVGDAGWAADYNDPRSYLYLHETRTGYQNYPGYSNPEFDSLVDQSDREADLERRADLMSRAEQLVLNDCPVCTTVFLVSTNLVHPRLAGWTGNLTDIHRARWFRDHEAV